MFYPCTGTFIDTPSRKDTGVFKIFGCVFLDESVLKVDKVLDIYTLHILYIYMHIISFSYHAPVRQQSL